MKYLEVTCIMRMEVDDACELSDDKEVGPVVRYEKRSYQPAIEWMINDPELGLEAFISLGEDPPFQAATLVGFEDSVKFLDEKEYAEKVPAYGRG